MTSSFYQNISFTNLSSFTVLEVRQYAVRRLGESSDEDLMLYLLQLVQALKYEPYTPDTFTFNEAYYSDDFDIIGGQSAANKPQKHHIPDISLASATSKIFPHKLT